MTSREEHIQKIKDLIQGVDDMTDPLFIRELMPQIDLKAVLDNIPVTFKNKPMHLNDVLVELLTPSQPHLTLALSEPQQIALQAEKEKEKAIIMQAISHLQQLDKDGLLSSEQTLINLLEPYRRFLFSPITNDEGKTLLEIAQLAYSQITTAATSQKSEAMTSASEPEWKKHHTREMQVPFRAAPLKTNDRTPSPAAKSQKIPEKPVNH